MAIGTIIAAIVYGVSYTAAAATTLAVVINTAVAIASIAYSISSYKQGVDAQKKAQFESLQRNGYRNFRQPLVPRRLVYGRVRVAGPVIFAHNRQGYEAHLVIALAAHEVEEISKIYMLREELDVQRTQTTPLPSKYGRVTGKYVLTLIMTAHNGSPTQDVGLVLRTIQDPRPNSYMGTSLGLVGVIKTTDKFQGIACLYAITKGFSSTWEGQSPEFGALLKGKRLYHPGTEETVWSSNPALVIADYMVNIMGISWENIDTDALLAAYAVCNENVVLADLSTERRYEINGIVSADMEHRDVLETMARAMAGAVRYCSGKWFIEAGTSKESVMTITEAMVIDGYEVDFERPDFSLPNAVRGNFMDRLTWQAMSYPQFVDESAVTAEGATNWLDVDLPMTTSHTMAQRIARIMLYKARARKSLSISLNLTGMLVKPGDVITYSAPEIGIVDQLFEIQGWTLGRMDREGGPALITKLELVDYDPTIYEWDGVEFAASMVRGSVELNNVTSKTIIDPVYYQSAITTTPGLVVSYSFSWGNPPSNTLTLKQIDLVVTIKITYTDGSTQRVTRTFVEASGDETRLCAFNETYLSGKTFASVEVVTALLTAKFTNNTSDGPVTAVAV